MLPLIDLIKKTEIEINLCPRAATTAKKQLKLKRNRVSGLLPALCTN